MASSKMREPAATKALDIRATKVKRISVGEDVAKQIISLTCPSRAEEFVSLGY